MGIAKIHGGQPEIDKARHYRVSSPQIEWACCPGVICGHAERTGVTTDDYAVYRLSGFRHPELTGTLVVVLRDGSLAKPHNGEVVQRAQP